jgi:hypothetical protein
MQRAFRAICHYRYVRMQRAFRAICHYRYVCMQRAIRAMTYVNADGSLYIRTNIQRMHTRGNMCALFMHATQYMRTTYTTKCAYFTCTTIHTYYIQH